MRYPLSELLGADFVFDFVLSRFVEPRKNRKSREKERKRQEAREKLGVFPTTDAHYTRKNCGLAPGWKYTW